MGCDPGILTGSVSLKDAEAALRRISYRPTEEKVDKEFPYLLMTGRTLHPVQRRHNDDENQEQEIATYRFSRNLPRRR
jgi:hypothetical protein